MSTAETKRSTKTSFELAFVEIPAAVWLLRNRKGHFIGAIVDGCRCWLSFETQAQAEYFGNGFPGETLEAVEH